MPVAPAPAVVDFRPLLVMATAPSAAPTMPAPPAELNRSARGRDVAHAVDVHRTCNTIGSKAGRTVTGGGDAAFAGQAHIARASPR